MLLLYCFFYCCENDALDSIVYFCPLLPHPKNPKLQKKGRRQNADSRSRLSLFLRPFPNETMRFAFFVLAALCVALASMVRFFARLGRH